MRGVVLLEKLDCKNFVNVLITGTALRQENFRRMQPVPGNPLSRKPFQESLHFRDIQTHQVHFERIFFAKCLKTYSYRASFIRTVLFKASLWKCWWFWTHVSMSQRFRPVVLTTHKPLLKNLKFFNYIFSRCTLEKLVPIKHTQRLSGSKEYAKRSL